ncbi:MAG: TetR/AcrR family transcriptional regulator [Acidimicrobiales bacterium]
MSTKAGSEKATSNATVETSAQTSRQRLTRSSVVLGAIALADEHGVAALTMRNLAERLGYKVMALYNHVSNKDELLTLMADAVAEEIEEVSPDLQSLEAVRALAISTRAALVRHPWSCELWLQCLPGLARSTQMETLLRMLDQSGLPPDLAHHGFHAVNNHVTGYTLVERGISNSVGDNPEAVAKKFVDSLPVESFPYTLGHVKQHMDGDTSSSFELVLDLILDGLTTLAAER